MRREHQVAGVQPDRRGFVLDEPTRALQYDIGGIYDAAADHDHYLTTGPLDEWFDAVVHVRTITPTNLLSQRPR
ncbi:hypothetical protein OG946_01115 [Streptomyces sp. NBC_01808]|uniref:hypothetical protein n=1 Tax=Streptomyces sp. NBC_01808 TaxID=2975947 RepID=UPI002DDA9510|nr:hypothetical protein [Streptomyces sp. NBC_01808]WSA36093.1 hypothetical protein OG946_01115 [Streptomyces sp. NBC_01808]